MAWPNFRRDFERTFSALGGNSFQRYTGCLRTPGLHAVAVYRFGHWLLKRPVALKIVLKPLYLLLYRRMRARWGIEINHEAKIGEGLLIFHYGGIFIGATVVMGKNCSISHNVTIGLSGRGSRRGAPVLGDNVYVAPGANISGRIKVGHNAHIGANTVIDRHVPDNALVQLPPMRSVVFPGLYSGGADRTDADGIGAA
jgi:serine O-acetyltransferase